MGFDFPAHEWLRGPLRSLLLDTLSANGGRRVCSGADALENCVRQHLDRRANLGYHLWGLMLLLLWMKRWRIQTTQTFGREPASARQTALRLLSRLLFAAAIYLGCILSPPSLMDDVDAVQAQIARNMLQFGRLGDGAASTASSTSKNRR